MFLTVQFSNAPAWAQWWFGGQYASCGLMLPSYGYVTVGAHGTTKRQGLARIEHALTIAFSQARMSALLSYIDRAISAPADWTYAITWHRRSADMVLGALRAVRDDIAGLPPGSTTPTKLHEMLLPFTTRG
jgi:hypothetical protein